MSIYPPVQWHFSKDSKMLYFTAADKARESVFSVPVQGGAVKQVLRQGSNEQFQVARATTICAGTTWHQSAAGNVFTG